MCNGDTCFQEYFCGSPLDIACNRPIYVLTIFSELFEKLMVNSLMNYLNKFYLLNNDHFCLRSGRSTCDFLNIYKSLNAKQDCVGVIVDFRKAFDTANLSILN